MSNDTKNIFDTNLTISIRDFIKAAEFDVAEKMIEAYNEGNQEAFNTTVARTVFNNIFPLNVGILIFATTHYNSSF